MWRELQVSEGPRRRWTLSLSGVMAPGPLPEKGLRMPLLQGVATPVSVGDVCGTEMAQLGLPGCGAAVGGCSHPVRHRARLPQLLPTQLPVSWPGGQGQRRPGVCSEEFMSFAGDRDPISWSSGRTQVCWLNNRLQEGQGGTGLQGPGPASTCSGQALSRLSQTA